VAAQPEMDQHYSGESLSQDVIHGFIPICSPTPHDEPDEKTERDLIDSPWVQRLRQIYQLQTAWFVYPTAEHTRFQHSLGAMYLASRAIEQLYPSLQAETALDRNLPSRPYVESLVRIAALLHDVGHGPFGHFFDSHFLVDFGLTHEKLGAIIIRRELGELIRSIRRSPQGRLLPNEILDPEQVAFLIVRPEKEDTVGVPRWLRLLRTLFCGLYTVDNMDFVLRDAYFTGVNRSGFNLDRLLHYTFFSPQGLTIHQKGFSTLTQFLTVRAELFRSVYFHRTVRAVDLTLTDLFEQSKPFLFPIRECTGMNTNRNPAENLEEYRFLTDRTLMSEIAFWSRSEQPEKRRLGELWNPFLRREIPWKVAAETTAIFQSAEKERSSIFSNPTLFETAIRTELPKEIQEIELRVDIARHLHRPGKNLPTKNLNFLYDSNNDRVRSLEEEEVFRHIPLSFKICRVYTKYAEHRKDVADALSKLLSISGGDDLTNM